MKIQLPKNITTNQVVTLLEAFELLVDYLIACHQALCDEYRAMSEEDLDEYWDDDIPL